MQTEIRKTPSRFVLNYGPADGAIVTVDTKKQPDSIRYDRTVNRVQISDFYDWDDSLQKYMWSPNHPFDFGRHAFTSPKHPIGQFAM